MSTKRLLITVQFYADVPDDDIAADKWSDDLTDALIDDIESWTTGAYPRGVHSGSVQVVDYVESEED